MNNKCEIFKEKVREKHLILPEETINPICAILNLPEPKNIIFAGPPGTGKTETAKIIADVLCKPIERIQVFPGITKNEFFGEWDYKRQLLEIQSGKSTKDVYNKDYFIKGPAVKALEENGILFVDEVNRGGTNTPNMILEIAGEKQVTIPNLGTIKGDARVIATINEGDIGTTRLSHAFKRRFLRVEFFNLKGKDLERMIDEFDLGEAVEVIGEKLADPDLYTFGEQREIIEKINEDEIPIEFEDEIYL